MDSCEIEVREVSGTAVLAVTGDIDREAESAVSTAYEQAIASDPRRVILDFHSTEYINSSGIALIVSVLARARSEGRSVAAVGLSDHYREIFEIHAPVRLHRALRRPRRGGRPGSAGAMTSGSSRKVTRRLGPA